MFSNLFSLDPQVVYLNHAAVAPWPVCAVEAVCAFARENGSAGASNYPHWLTLEAELRNRLAALIQAPSVEHIALLKSTSEGLSVVAHGLDWRAGENLVSVAQEFPSNRIVWESLQPRGVEVRLLDLDSAMDPEARLMELCDANTRLLAVSSVQYARGRRMDLQRLGEFCRSRGLIFVVDAIQSLGAFPLDVEAIHADAVAADGHKWMLGPEGMALFYCRDWLRERLALHQFGWHMVEQAGDFERSDWQPAASARRFECGSPNLLGAHALHASLGLLHEVGIATVSRNIQDHCDRIIEHIDAGGFELLTPRESRLRAGIVTFAIPGIDSKILHQALMQRQVICAQRGGGVRFSPHFHTTPAQIDEAFRRLDEALNE